MRTPPATDWRGGGRSAAAGTVALSSSFLTGVEQNSAVPASVKAEASTQLASGVPFISDEQLEKALDENAAVTPAASDAIVAENEQGQLAGLRARLSVLALVALAGFVLSSRLPARQPAASASAALDPVAPV